MEHTKMPGGVFNAASVNYSPETQKILKVLADEAKLGFKTQRNVISRMLSGAPLPQPRVQSAPNRQTNLFNIKKNYHFSKRTQEQMKRNGAYDFEQFRPLKPYIDRSAETAALQEIMEYGQKLDPKFKKKFSEPKPILLTRAARIDEITEEINERMTFLDNMRALGEEKPYEQSIKQEISSKLLELKRVQRMTDDDFQKLGLTK